MAGGRFPRNLARKRHCWKAAVPQRAQTNPCPDTPTTPQRGVLRYLTPCIKRLINGATMNSSTPEPTSAQKPKV